MSNHDELRLRSTENGWIGVDPETGDPVPVPFESLETETSLSDSPIHRRRHFAARDVDATVTDFGSDSAVSLAANATAVSSPVWTPPQSIECTPSDGFNDRSEIAIDMSSKGIVDMSNRTLYAALRFPSDADMSNLEHVEADFRTPDFDNRIEVSRTLQYLEDDWIIFSFPLADTPSETGTVDLTNVDSLRFWVTAESGESLTCYVDSLWTEQTDQSLFTMCYDDGDADVFSDFLPTHREYDIPFSAAIITDRIGNDGRMSDDQLAALRRLGMDVNSHTETHDDLTSLSIDEAEDSVRTAVHKLRERGFVDGARSLVAPFGPIDHRFQVLRQYHDLTATTLQRVNSYPLQDPHRVYRINAGTTSLLDIQAHVDDVETHGGHLVLYAHHTDDLSVSKLDSILSYVGGSSLESKTLTEVLEEHGV